MEYSYDKEEEAIVITQEEEDDVLDIYQVTLDMIREYLRDEVVSDAVLERYRRQAINYIEQYTACVDGELVGEAAPVEAMLAIIGDMHDNRSYQGDRTYINLLVESTLAMYRRNLV